MSNNKNDKERLFRHVFSIDTCDLLSEEELYGTLQAMGNSYRANFLVRLKDQSYVVLKDLVADPADRIEYDTAQEMIDANVRLKIKEEYLASALAFVDLRTLSERMKDTDYIQLEYPNILNIWCVASFSVVERIDGIVTMVVFSVLQFTYDIDRTQELLMMQKEAISLLSDSELLFVTAINKENGETKILQTTRPEFRNHVYDFDRSMQKEAKYIYPADQEEFLENVQLEALKENLKKTNPYTISVYIHFPEHDGFRRKNYHFSYNKAFPNYILSATEDVTERYTCDQVTGMKNYAGFKMDCMFAFFDSDPQNYAVLNFNLANFKAVNATYSHEAGNWLLKKVMSNISESEVPFLSVCRENADNFFCLCRKEDCEEEKLNHLCEMVISDDDDFSETTKLYCGIYPITDSHETINEICDKARLARRYAERDVGSNIWVLNEKENRKYLDEASIQSSVSKAIQDGEIVIHYQPIYDAQSGKIASSEALVRWHHPEKGILPPGVFIPAIERTGQIAEVDIHVAQHVVRLQNNLFASGKTMIPISFNVSRYDFLQEKYMAQAIRAMQKSPNVADMIRIEITETAMINITEKGKTFLREMRNMGIKTLIDDFGTGYSSLATIGERMSDIIKLDMIFARQIGIDEQMEILIRAAIETAHYMGIQVVAEGVETKEQYEFLKQWGCDYVQGYYFSKPLPEEDFLNLLEETQQTMS